MTNTFARPRDDAPPDRALDLDLARAHELDLDRALDRALGLTCALDLDLDYKKKNAGQLPKLLLNERTKLREQLASLGLNPDVRTQRLAMTVLLHLLDLAEAADFWQARTVVRQLALLIIEHTKATLPKVEKREIEKFELMLKILLARQQGELPAWEGIFLVRDLPKTA